MLKYLLSIFAVLAICSANCAAYQITLKYATHTRVGDEFARLVTEPFFADITRATDGQVKVESYFSEMLLSHDQMWDGLADGSADLGLVISPFYYARTPLSNVMDLPTIPQNANAETHAGAMWRLYEKYPEMQAEYLSQDIRPLLFISTGTECLFTSRPVAKLEDLRGITLVADSPITVKQFNFFDSADIYQGHLYDIFKLTSNEAFGFIGAAEVFVLWDLSLTTPYATIAPLNTTYITIALSEKNWQALPDEIKAQIMAVAGETGSRRYSAAYSEHFSARIKTPGVSPTFITLTPEERQRWIDLNQPLVDEWLAANKALGQGEVARKMYNDLVE